MSDELSLMEQAMSALDGGQAPSAPADTSEAAPADDAVAAEHADEAGIDGADVAGEGVEEEAEEAAADAEADDGLDEEGERAEASEDGGEDEGDDRAPQTFKVKVDGEELEVTADELVRGYQRQADYTRKTQQVAEMRRQLEAEQAQFKQIMSQLEHVIPQVMAGAEAEPDWPALAQRLSAEEYNRVRAEWEREQQQKQAALQAFQQYQQQEQAQRLAQEIDALLQSRPDWRDPTKLEGVRREIEAVAGDYGFSPEEIAGVTDHRIILALSDLAEMKRAAQAGRQLAEKKRAKPKPGLKPGARKQEGGANRRIEELRKRVAKGDEQAAQELLAQLPI